MARMPSPEALAAFRAAAETIVPPTEHLAGGADLDVHEHVVALIEQGLPGFGDMIAALLDAYAAEVRPDSRFAELEIEERSRVLRAMSSDDSQDIRDAVDAIIVFSLGGTFSEWTGYDRSSRELKPPRSWSVVGFHGPVHGHPTYREDA
jgi:hypothetical protein